MLYGLWQWTWGFLQSFVGLAVLLTGPRRAGFWYRGARVTRWGLEGSVSLGMFIFLGRSWREEDVDLLRHEYGHTLQSLLLGPAYLVVVGLPSVLWAGTPGLKRLRRRRGMSYYDFYTERWADAWGGCRRRGPGSP